MNSTEFPKKWAEWTVTDLLGKGSFGKVYEIEKDGHKSALKVIRIPSEEGAILELRRDYSSDDSIRGFFREMVEDYQKEIQFMSSLKESLYIVKIEDYEIEELTDVIGWNIYIQMECLESLNDYQTHTRMTEEKILQLATEIGSALRDCEKGHILHRDLKADNILVTEDGHFKLGDFGVAKNLDRTQGTFSIKGSLAYMAPEVILGKKYDNRADLYSLGLILYRLTNKRRDPFVDQNKQILTYRDRRDAHDRRLSAKNCPLL